VSLATAVFGAVAGIECRRALARGWLTVVRTLVGSLLALVVFFVIWIWQLDALLDPFFHPDVAALRTALAAAVMILATIAVVQAPAVLAGSLAGERERGVLQLLLTTPASPREIVLGRLLGKLSQVAMILLAGVPLLAILVAWNGHGLVHLATIALVLAALSLGGGGLAIGASVVSRRGRDALLTVYILMLLLTLSPMLSALGLPVPIARRLATFNPYLSLNELVRSGRVIPALLTSGFWILCGLAGLVTAVWRLRRSCVTAPGTTARTSRRRIPPLGERPMLWKELYVERAGTLGRFGRWLGVLITGSVGIGSLVLAGIIIASSFAGPESAWHSWATSLLGLLVGGFAGSALGWVLQWGVGLRAAVSIASERERGTWDALMLSPLEPAELAHGKLYGSIYALRWMAGAMLLAATLGMIFEVLTIREYVAWVAGNALGCALMAAVGVRCSLALPTATRAMTWTLALWLVGRVLIAFLACSLIAIGVLFCLALWTAAIQYGLIPFNSAPWLPLSWGTSWALASNLVTLLIALVIVVDTGLRFDRIAGRMAGGAVGTAVDSFLHGKSRRAVWLPERKPRPTDAAEPRTRERVEI
jgi:ABC-type Na+ efflux pump permease subunit